MAQVKAGTLKGLAVTGSKRLAQLPEIPTTLEAGVVGFDVSSWFGLVAPAKTPLSLVKQLSAQTADALREADVQQRLVGLGVRSIGSTPEEFIRFLRKDRAKWNEIIVAAHIRLE
jgi:tripartite-type tricarboxylate transporter receptor subunit TctC